MRYLLAPMFLAGFLCVAQTTAPATQPTTRPTTKNPDVEAILATFPEELVTEAQAIADANSTKIDAKGRSTETMTEAKAFQKRIMDNGAKVRAWSKANADGKTISVTAIRGDATHADCCYLEADGSPKLILNVLPKKLISDVPLGQTFTVKGTVGIGGLSMGRHRNDNTTTFYLTLQKCELAK